MVAAAGGAGVSIAERLTVRTAVLLAASVVGCGCSGGIHRQGEQRISLTAGYGLPIKSDVLYPDGEGRAESSSLTVGYDYFAADRLALHAVATPYRLYDQSDGNVYAGEFQLGLRYYFWEFAVIGMPVALYGEVLGGMMNGARSVPEEGSNTNFTQDTGVGFEVVLSPRLSWIGGYRLKHLSNGRIFRTDSNPSQNDHFVYTGLSMSIP